MAERRTWDKKRGLGRQKIFEVRRLHCDATFLDEFLTPEFCVDQNLFVTKEDGRPVPSKAVIPSREFNEIKQLLLFQFTNGGKPVIEVTDGNHSNRKELLLTHKHVGVDLRWDWAKEVLQSLARLWCRPVHLATHHGSRQVVLSHDGKESSETAIEAPASVAS